MTDNPHIAEPLVFALPDHRVVSLTGRDAVAFAQAQFMNDVTALPVGYWQWNGWLTPKGRVIALFALLKLSEDALWLVFGDLEPGDLVELSLKLSRYIFRSKLEISVRHDWRVHGAFAESQHGAGSQVLGNIPAGSIMDGVELDMSGDGVTRTLRITTESSAIDPDAVTRWSTFDLMHGLPRLPASQTEQWTPQQLSLDRLKAYSVRKGCYPGQEIVARTHFLGQAKRGLVLFDSEQPLHPGSEIREDSTTHGTIVSAAAGFALAVMPPVQPGQELHVDGVPIHERSLMDGLSR